MPLSYEIDGGVVYITVTGKVEFQEQMDFDRALLADPELPSPLKLLRDLRRQEGMIANSDRWRQKIVDFAKRSIPGACLAIVASEDVYFGVSRMYEAWLDETVNVMVFRSFDDAQVWLQASEEEIADEGPP